MKEQKKSKIPYFFFVFFAVIFAVNAFYIYVSQTTWRGIAIEDSYQKGLDYNSALAEERKQQDLGWKMVTDYKNTQDNRGDNRGVVTIDLLDKNSNKITDANIFIYFRRPTQDGRDFSQILKFKDGFYRADISFPLQGQWDFEIKATLNSKDGNKSYQDKIRYIIK